MKIILNNSYIGKRNTDYKLNKKNLAEYKKHEVPAVSNAKIPLAALKSNFCLSFGKYKKVGEVVLVNKDTEKPVVASLRKEKIGDFISYKIFTGKEEAGYMDMDCDALFPEGDYVLTEPDNVIPEVSHLRSLLGDKYSGIGTSLINAAVKESLKAGKNGSLWLNAEKGYARGFSSYRSDENPIPFYYKLGFRAVEPGVDKFIQKCLENSDYRNLPDSALLLLTPNAIKAKNKYFAQNFVYS